MIVFSCFDGISCARVALERAKIKVDKYYASEIDKYAISITQKNYPDTIQFGDIQNWRTWNIEKPDLIIGGSPCQGFSFAGKQLNFNDPRSKLFFDFVDILKFYKPKYFLLENVKMKKEWQDIISTYLEVEPIEINSALVSAQNRNRLYWTNIPNIKQPENKDINLEDILEKNIPSKYWLSIKERSYMDRETRDGRTHWDFKHHSDTNNAKSSTIVANFMKGVPYNVLIDRRGNNCFRYDCQFVNDESCNCIDGDSYQESYNPNKTIRKFTPIECERLQTIPDNYSDSVSNSQRYKMLGNGWTVDIIANILSNLKSN